MTKEPYQREWIQAGKRVYEIRMFQSKHYMYSSQWKYHTLPTHPKNAMLKWVRSSIGVFMGR